MGVRRLSKQSGQKEIVILKEIAELLNEGTDTQSVLSEVLKKLLEVTGLKVGWIFLIDQNGNHELVASEQLPPALRENECLRMKKGKCWCVNRFYSGKLTKATNIIECQRIENVITNQLGDHSGLTHHATVPLRAGNERFGLLNVGSPNKTYFNDNELGLLESIAYQIGTALKRIKLTKLEKETALIAERNRLARDLHDSVNQLLFSLSLTARAGVEMTNDERLKDTFHYIQDLAQEALGEMRALIWQLRPQGLENGIISALRGYAEMLGLKVNVALTGITSLPVKIEEALWRIGQEALANCKKHANSTCVNVRLSVKDNEVELAIEDDGCGFIYQPNANIPSLGLKNMKMRAESLNGSFTLNSTIGKGTKVTVKLPI